MDRTKQQEKKDAAHMWFGLAIAAVIAAGVAFAVWFNGQEADQVRVAAYAGRSVEPNRAPLVLIVLLTVVAIVGIGLAWWRTVRNANGALASMPDDTELDWLFSGDELVSAQAGHAGMAHSVLVVGARERGYVLSSQGADGSMVFERSLGREGAGEAAVSVEQPEDQSA